MSGSGNTSSEVSAPINVPQLADPTSIASASNVALQEAESGHDLLVSSDHSNSTQQAASNASQHTVSCALMIPVTEVGKRTAKFRVVADLTGGLILESNSVNESIDLGMYLIIIMYIIIIMYMYIPTINPLALLESSDNILIT